METWTKTCDLPLSNFEPEKQLVLAPRDCFTSEELCSLSMEGELQLRPLVARRVAQAAAQLVQAAPLALILAWGDQETAYVFKTTYPGANYADFTCLSSLDPNMQCKLAVGQK